MTKSLLITGASRGIGAATARLAAQRGYDVCVNFAGNAAAADAVVRDCKAHGRKALAVQADVSKPAEIARLFEAFDRDFGRLDAFFNNAGIFAHAARFVDIPVARVEHMIATNTIGAFIAAQHAVRRMSTRLGGKGGAIVNMSSIAAKLGGAFEATDYGFSKGAIDTLTIGLAKEVAGEGFFFNDLGTCVIYTDIHASGGQPDRVDRLASQIPMQRGGTAEEVAEAVLWLLSEQSSYVTGTMVDIAGGRGL